MTPDLDSILQEIEAVTAAMLAANPDQGDRFAELCETRAALARLLARRPLDPPSAERLKTVIEAGSGLVARVMAVRESILREMSRVEWGKCYTRELSGSVPTAPPRLSLKA